MTTAKRRVIWMNDEDWEGVLRQAAANKVTASQLVRDCLQRGHLRVDREQNAATQEWPPDPSPADLWGKPTAGPSFNSRGSRPVPK